MIPNIYYDVQLMCAHMCPVVIFEVMQYTVVWH